MEDVLKRHVFVAAVSELPVVPANEAVDRVAGARFGDGQLMLFAVEAVRAAGDAIGPRGEDLTARGLAHLVHRVALEHWSHLHRVRTEPAAHFDRARPLVAELDLVLRAGRMHRLGYRFTPAGSARTIVRPWPLADTAMASNSQTRSASGSS